MRGLAITVLLLCSLSVLFDLGGIAVSGFGVATESSFVIIWLAVDLLFLMAHFSGIVGSSLILYSDPGKGRIFVGTGAIVSLILLVLVYASLLFGIWALALDAHDPRPQLKPGAVLGIILSSSALRLLFDSTSIAATIVSFILLKKSVSSSNNHALPDVETLLPSHEEGDLYQPMKEPEFAEEIVL